MKALTNILTRLLMLMLLMLVACTEETAEVDNLTRGEQYVQVRMQVPGMTAAATRAADGEITSVTALSFNSSDQLLDVKTVNPINNVNANNGYNGNFNLTVPNGTQTIHFLANLPLNYSNEQTYVDFLKAKKGQSQVDVMTSLTTTDYNNLVYWGMTTYDGSNSTLSTTLYRNMAKISIKPSEGEDAALNVFKQNDLTIAGLVNANLSGTLLPYSSGFYESNSAAAPDFLTLPNPAPTRQNIEYNALPSSVYAFEHMNENYEGRVLHVICKIGTYCYKVALIDENSNPYDIIRNHEYIIYVSDVDDYAHDDNYRASGYNDALSKKPINLEVKEVESVTFGETPQSIDVDGNLTVTMTVPEEGTVTALTISAPGFTIKQGETKLGDGSYTRSDLNIAGNSTVTYTFVPNTFGKDKGITFTASGTNLQETINNINVDVNAAISASPTVNNPTLYYDQDNQTVTVNVTMPKGLSAISIGGAGNFMVSQGGNAMTIDNGLYTYTRNDATATEEVQFVFTLDKSKYTSQQGNTSATFTFSDASTAVDKATQASVSVNLIPTVVTFSYTGAQTITLGNSLDVVMTVPYGKSLSDFRIEVTSESDLADFVVTQDSTPLTLDDGVYTTTNVSGEQTFTFTPSATGTYTITFSGSGTDVNMPAESDRKVTLTVEEGREMIVLWGDDEEPKDMEDDQFVITEEDLSGKTVCFEIMTLVETGHAEFQVLNKWTTNFEIFSAEKGTLDYNTNESQIIEVDIPSGREGLGIRAYNIKLIKVYYYSTE